MLLAAVAGLTGCVIVSVYPFYHDKDVVFDPVLVGTWSQEDGGTWKFAEAGPTAYRLTYTDGNQTSEMEVRLFKLQGQLFLDLFGKDSSDHEPPPIPSHLLLRVDQLGPVTRLSALSYKWVKAAVAKDPKLVRHHVIKSNDEEAPVLTADTAELQQFVVKVLKVEDAWEKPIVLKRDAVPASPPTTR